MPSRAGQPIRALAQRRRTQAGVWVALAIACVAVPLGLPWAWEQWMQESLTVPLWGWAIAVVSGLLCFREAQARWKLANYADQGAAAEEAIADLLIPLQYENWQIDYNVRDRSVGDIDVVLLSPDGQTYTIDVKSHSGKVGTNGKQLYRLYNRSKYPFEKDFLAQAKRQAIAVKKRRKLSWVTPIVVFTNAIVEVGHQPIAGVRVIPAADLLAYLRSDLNPSKGHRSISG